MALYQIIYDWLNTSVFTAQYGNMSMEIMGVTLTFQSWLCHTCTLIIMGFILVSAGLFIRWLFREFSSMFSRIGG